MIVTLHTQRLHTLAQVRAFVAGSEPLSFTLTDRQVFNQHIGRIPALSIIHFPSNGDGLAGKAIHPPIKFKNQQEILLKRGFKRLGMWDFSRRHTTAQLTVSGRNMSSGHDRTPVEELGQPCADRFHKDSIAGLSRK